MILNAHDKTIAILDLAFAMLEHGITEHGMSLLRTNELRISSKKLEFFVRKAQDLNRVCLEISDKLLNFSQISSNRCFSG